MKKQPAREIKWVYGVTTVPARRNDLLPATLTSLKAAGFDKPRLFVDGEYDTQDWVAQFNLEVTVRHPKILLHGNWFLALHELFIRHPMSDRYAIFQDDLVASKNLRQYLDACQYPSKGYWNLYTAPQSQGISQGVEGWYRGIGIGAGPAGFQKGLGALGLVFDRETTATLLASAEMVGRPMEPTRGWRSIDGGVVHAMNKTGRHEYVHNPSLLQHTGVTSSFDKRRQADGKDENHPIYRWPSNAASVSFRGEDFDCLTLLQHEDAVPH